jgi:hypothetical protein
MSWHIDGIAPSVHGAAQSGGGVKLSPDGV